jgi:hypothetical protein
MATAQVALPQRAHRNRRTRSGPQEAVTGPTSTPAEAEIKSINDDIASLLNGGDPKSALQLLAGNSGKQAAAPPAAACESDAGVCDTARVRHLASVDVANADALLRSLDVHSFPLADLQGAYEVTLAAHARAGQPRAAFDLLGTIAERGAPSFTGANCGAQKLRPSRARNGAAAPAMASPRGSVPMRASSAARSGRRGATRANARALLVRRPRADRRLLPPRDRGP